MPGKKFLYVPNTVDALAYMQLKNEQIGRDFNSNYPAKMPNIFGPADFEAYQNGTKKTSNYVDAAFDKVSPQYQHNLSINGGGKKLIISSTWVIWIRWALTKARASTIIAGISAPTSMRRSQIV